MPMWYETAARSFAAEARPRGRQVADGAGEGLLGVEASVDRAALLAEPVGPRGVPPALRARDLHGQRAALVEVDRHPEEVLRGLREDLRQARGVDRVVARR